MSLNMSIDYEKDGRKIMFIFRYDYWIVFWYSFRFNQFYFSFYLNESIVLVKSKRFSNELPQWVSIDWKQ